MFRPSIASLLSAALIGSALISGCDSGDGTTSAPQGHDGRSATGHTGGTPAGGPNSPDAKAVPNRGPAAK